MKPRSQKQPTRSSRRTWARRILAGLVLCVALPPLGFAALSWAFPFPSQALEAVRSSRLATLVLDREGAILRAFPSSDDSRMFWTALDAIGPRLAQATIAVEDQRFRSHPGVDPLAAARAAWSNLAQWRTVSGASTLTMQLVRLIENRPRTLGSKLVEAFRALQLERLLGKPQILEWYLNLAPYGGNHVGVEAASLSYFGKHAADLTLAEAALLAGLPQSPSRLRPDRYPSRAKARRDHVLARMHACGFITDQELATALAEPVTIRRGPAPADGLHFALLARERNPGRGPLRTTLDRRIQTLSETAIREAVGRLRAAGVSNGAVVVIENATGAVRALVGSCDFFSEDDQGQVNGATAPRSPGSALKPFTYALAFELGLITPDSVLADIPANYTGYEPENYDRSYRGPVAAREALAASLNIPAVRLLQQVGPPALLNFLRDLGLTTLTRDARHYGLSLTLGSTETTLLELTNAYATLARLGVHRPYRLLETEPPAPGRRVLSEGAAYLVADVLTDTTRLNGATLWRPEFSGVRMAWKTGTSFGHRDAWTITYTPDYTVGVWLGNFSGKPSRELVGVRVAAPVAARIMNQLYGGRPSSWYARPASVGSRRVCAVSGLPLGDHCPQAAEGQSLPGRSSDRPCSIHVEVKVGQPGAEQGAVRFCPACARGRDYTVRVMELWPGELAAWLRQHGRGANLAPPHFAGCPRREDGETPPQILSPASGQSYVLLEADGQPPQKLLLRAVSRMGKLYWFVDGALHATSVPLEGAFWPLRRGPHTIVCSDDVGRSSSIAIEVR